MSPNKLSLNLRILVFILNNQLLFLPKSLLQQLCQEIRWFDVKYLIIDSLFCTIDAVVCIETLQHEIKIIQNRIKNTLLIRKPKIKPNKNNNLKFWHKSCQAENETNLSNFND